MRTKIENNIIQLAKEIQQKGIFETISFKLFGGKRMLYI